MNKNDEEDSSESDFLILSSLQGIKCLLQDFQRGHTAAAPQLLRYYEELPKDVSNRLTELDPEVVKRTAFRAQSVSQASIRKIGSSSALNQVIRAANVYRERLGYRPLGENGFPAEGD